jgi:hypothetical protein
MPRGKVKEVTMGDKKYNGIGYKREIERGGELSYWITLDRKREKALKELERQKYKKEVAKNGRNTRRSGESSEDN